MLSVSCSDDCLHAPFIGLAACCNILLAGAGWLPRRFDEYINDHLHGHAYGHHMELECLEPCGWASTISHPLILTIISMPCLITSKRAHAKYAHDIDQGISIFLTSS